jgi:signal transduction histidine kinase
MDFPRTEAALALQSVPYIILIIATISRFIRQPIASFFSGLLTGVAGLVALLLVHTGTRTQAEPAFSLSTADTRFSILCFLGGVFALFLLARHLTHVARWLQWSLTALFFLNALLVMVPAAFRLTALLFFIGVCPLPFVFWRQSQRNVGAARRQAQWIGAALVLVLAHLLLITTSDLTSLGAAATFWYSFFLSLLSGIALCLGFTPPRWLWNFWQTAERARIVRLFDHHLLGGTQPVPGTQSGGLAEMLEDVLQHAMRALTCQAGVIERWNETANTFEALASASATALASPRELFALKNGRLGEAFIRQRVMAAPLDTARRFLPWFRSSLGELLAAPILANGKAVGVLGLACEHPPLFPETHLSLLEAFAEQVALWLVYYQPSPTSTALLERAAQEQQAKDEFIAVMVHELRSPLTVLKGRLQLLKRQFTKENQASALESVNRLDPQIHRLEKLIDTFVDVSYLDAGRFRLNKEPLDLAALVGAVVERNRRLCTVHTLMVEGAEAGQSDAGTLDSPQPMWVLGDSSRLTQVLQVLLGQACTATPAGSAITVHLIRSEVEREAVVQVHDQGAGIPLEQQTQVFKRQMPSLTGPGEKMHKTGLELYISYETIRHHGGRMSLESSGLPGEGATFSFSLPLLSPQDVAAMGDLSGPGQASRHHHTSQESGNAHLAHLPRSADQASDREEHQEITSH